MTTIILLLILGLLIYFLPAFIASDKRHGGLIFLFNLFFGITGIGWLAALIWALCEPSKADLEKIDKIYQYVKEQKNKEKLLPEHNAAQKTEIKK